LFCFVGEVKGPQDYGACDVKLLHSLASTSLSHSTLDSTPNLAACHVNSSVANDERDFHHIFSVSNPALTLQPHCAALQSLRCHYIQAPQNLISTAHAVIGRKTCIIAAYQDLLSWSDS
jgi:hypothetical protein